MRWRLLLFVARRRLPLRALAASVLALALLASLAHQTTPRPANVVYLDVQVPNPAFFDFVEVSTACCLVAAQPIDAAGRATFALERGDYLVSAPASGIGATHLRTAIPQRVHLERDMGVTLRGG